MWYDQSVFYQIYPLGFCGAPAQNDFSAPVCRIDKLTGWIAQMLETGANALYLGPIFSSDAHGYDTAEYRVLDNRLGTNADFAQCCTALHEAGIKIVLDGVFNHVGRNFWAFKDVQAHKWDSAYKDWFFIRDGNSGYNDGFYYEGWEGHYELVKLNLRNPAVQQHIFDCIAAWVREFGIDGLRLDVAYLLDLDFLRNLRHYTATLKQDFVLIGETLHGDYNKWCNQDACHSVTNYECYKGLFSALNSNNLFEIAHSLQRQFGSENWTLYKGKNLLCFLDNHDVSRIASQLSNPALLPAAYTLLCTMNGVPCVYYGSEWGEKGSKQQGDGALRPCPDQPLQTALTAHIAKLAHIRKTSLALAYGSYATLVLNNRQFAFLREKDAERIISVLNIGDAHAFDLRKVGGRAVDLLTQSVYDLNEPITVPACSSLVLQVQ